MSILRVSGQAGTEVFAELDPSRCPVRLFLSDKIRRWYSSLNPRGESAGGPSHENSVDRG